MEPPSAQEIRFAQYRRGLRPLVHESLNTALLVSGFRFLEAGEKIDETGSEMVLGHTLKGQIFRPYVTFCHPKSGEPETIEVSIAHTLPGWEPIITVSSTITDPVSVKPFVSPVPFKERDPVPDMLAIRDEVAACFRTLMG